MKQSGKKGASDKPLTTAEQEEEEAKMKPLTYIPLLLWLVVSNMTAFLMLMVVAPKAEDYAEQSLEQKRQQHENIQTPATDPANTPGGRRVIVLAGDTMLVQQVLGDSTMLVSTPVETRNSGIINVFEPFVGAMRPLQSVLLLAFIAGYLGGSLHALASLLHYKAHNELEHSWTLWYIVRPLKGATTAVIFSFILQAGLMTGVSGDSVVNPIGIIALSLLVGMSAHDAIARLGIVFSTFFNTHKHSAPSEKTGDVMYDNAGNTFIMYSDGTYSRCQKQEGKEDKSGIKGMISEGDNLH